MISGYEAALLVPIIKDWINEHSWEREKIAQLEDLLDLLEIMAKRRGFY